jgi:hypothetical protein
MEKTRLPGPFAIIRNSFLIFFKKDNFLYFLKIVLLNFLVTVALMVPITILVGYLGKESLIQGFGPTTTIFIPTIALVLGMAVWGFLIQAAIIVSVSRVVSGETLGVKETLKFAWGKLGKYFLTHLLTSLITLFGFILLIIPGIVFAVWFAFSQYIVIGQNVGPIEAIKASKKLISPNFWPVFGRLAAIMATFTIAQLVLSSLKFFGVMAVTLFSPLWVLAPYLLYQELRGPSAKTSEA